MHIAEVDTTYQRRFYLCHPFSIQINIMRKICCMNCMDFQLNYLNLQSFAIIQNKVFATNEI